jgi:hypothetical protein
LAGSHPTSTNDLERPWPLRLAQVNVDRLNELITQGVRADFGPHSQG